MQPSERLTMTRNELEEIVRKARGMDPTQPLQLDEVWDSLDHLAIIASLTQVPGAVPEGADLSEDTSLNTLAQKICG